MGTWRQIAALPNRRYKAAAVWHDGKVYVFGGLSIKSATSESYQNNHYIYDPSGNTWSTGPTLPTTGLAYAFSTAADGIHLIYPGTGAHYAIDPSATTPAWATRLSVPATARMDAHHFTDASGRFYLAGGRSAGTGEVLSVHRYDPTTNVWTSRANMPSVSANKNPTVSPGVLGSDGLIYLGYLGFTTSLITYDPATDAWGTTTAMPDTTAINVSVSRTPGGVVLAMPHERFSGSSTVLLRRIDGLDPATDAWSMGVLPDYPGTAWESSVATQPGGLMYLVGGVVADSSGVYIPTTQAWAYQQNEAPTAPTPRTLTGGVTVSTESANRASWTFNDPNAGDSQSAFNFYYRPTGTTTWTTVTKTSPNPWYDFAAGTLDPVEYEWQIEVYDASGEISPRTTSAIFTADDPPAGPSITYPINGQTVEQLETVIWSAPAQSSYQLRRVADAAGDPDTATVYFDTGEVVEPLTRSLQVEFDVNDRFEHVQVRVKDGGLWSVWVDVQVDVTYTPPPTPTFTAYPDPATGSLLVMIANSAPVGDEPAAAYNDVYVDDGDGFERKATELAANTAWRYWTPASGRDYLGAIRIVAVAANGTTATSS